jgi:hypothetical protein
LKPARRCAYLTAGEHDLSPELVADGGKLAFTSNRDGNYEIYVMNADASGPVDRLTTNGSLLSGQSDTVSIVVKPTVHKTTISDPASVTSATTDPNSTDDNATISTRLK